MNRTLLSIEIITLTFLSLLGIFACVAAGNHAIDFVSFGLSILPIFFLVVAIAGTGNDTINPLWGIVIALLFGTTLRTVFIINDRGSDVVNSLMSGQDISALLPGYYLVIGAVFFTSLGYILVGKNVRFRIEKVLPTQPKWSPNILFFITIACCAIALVATVVLVRTAGETVSGLEDLSRKRRGNVGGEGGATSEGHLVWLGLLPSYCVLTCTVVLTGAGQYAKSNAIRLLMLLSLGGSTIYPVIASSRSSLVYAILGAFIAYVARSSLDMKLLLRLGVVSFLCMIVVVLLGELRVLGNPTKSEQAFQGNLLDTTAHWFVGNQNHADIVKVADIYRAVPHQIPYKYGASFINIVFAPIPRSLWPEKPITSMGFEIREKVYGRDAVRAGGPPPGLVVECLVNFGIAGVIIGGFIAGIGLRVYYNSFSPIVRTNDIALMVYASTFVSTFYCLYTLDFTIILVRYIWSIITILAIVFTCRIFSGPDRTILTSD